MSEFVVAIDAGTQSIRAGLVAADGTIAHSTKVDITPYESPRPGWAEQDVEYYWSKLCEATQRVVRESGAAPGQLAALSLATQRQTIVPVDASGKALRPAIVWMDERKADARAAPRAVLAATRLIGAHDVVKYAVEYSRASWLRQHEPDVWERTHRLVFLSGFFTHRLTGEFRESIANVYGPWPFEVKRGAWVGPTNLRAKLFPIEPKKLPDLLPPGSAAGTVTAAAAEATGLPAGLPVIAGAADKACDVLGAGVLSPDVGYVSYGTTATFNVFTPRYVEVQRMLPPYPAAVPGAFHTEVQVMRGMWLVSWFAEEFGLRERSLAAEQHRTPEELLDELVRDVPAGCDGLVTLPTWTPGPGADAAVKGAVFGFSDVHTRAHLYRSILEGLAMAMREGADLTQRRTKVPVTSLRVSGGGSRSDVLMQITASVFGLPAHRTHTPETALVGAGILAAAGVGWYGSVEQAAAAMTRTSDVFDPRAGDAELYDRLREVYRRAPGRLLPLFTALRRVVSEARRP